MIDKLDDILNQYKIIKDEILKKENINDYKKYSELNKQLKNLEPIVTVYNKYKIFVNDLSEFEKSLNTEKDPDMNNFIKKEIKVLKETIISLENELKLLLIPKDTCDDRNIILEIRAGVGGDEASIFACDLFKMYSGYCENMGWKMNIISFIESEAGGYKEIICNITGKDVYSFLKYESGVHRVQRVPITETQGRIHTSAASVVVMPEVDDIDIHINMNDVRKDTFCSTGAGGQSVNTTYSAVRLTHIPSGIVVTCQDERSQIKNYDKALKVLRARLYKMEHDNQHNKICEQKKSMVQHGDRSDKIRTYNFPQNRITDHRIHLTLYNLTEVMKGNLKQLSEALKIANNEELLKQL